MTITAAAPASSPLSPPNATEGALPAADDGHLPWLIDDDDGLSFEIQNAIAQITGDGESCGDDHGIAGLHAELIHIKECLAEIKALCALFPEDRYLGDLIEVDGADVVGAVREALAVRDGVIAGLKAGDGKATGSSAEPVFVEI